MKVSVSLPGDDVAFLDTFARERGLDSRSAALQHAVQLLRTGELAAAYGSAWEDWEADPEHAAWDVALGDGSAS